MSPSRSLSLPIGPAVTAPNSRMMKRSRRRLGEWSLPENELTIPPCSGVFLAVPRRLAMVCA
eukprot:3763191-Pleurochrysis_carterae.AAC.1